MKTRVTTGDFPALNPGHFRRGRGELKCYTAHIQNAHKETYVRILTKLYTDGRLLSRENFWRPTPDPSEPSLSRFDFIAERAGSDVGLQEAGVMSLMEEWHPIQ